MPSLSLPKRKALDAEGNPLRQDATYTPLSPHARGHHIYHPERTVLRGDHEAVTAAPALWVPVASTSEEKAAALAVYRARRDESLAPAQPDPTAPRIAGLIPAERRRRALRNYHDKAGTIVVEGSLWDANDDFVKGNPDMFGPEAA